MGARGLAALGAARPALHWVRAWLALHRFIFSVDRVVVPPLIVVSIIWRREAGIIPAAGAAVFTFASLIARAVARATRRERAEIHECAGRAGRASLGLLAQITVCAKPRLQPGSFDDLVVTLLRERLESVDNAHTSPVDRIGEYCLRQLAVRDRFGLASAILRYASTTADAGMLRVARAIAAGRHPAGRSAVARSAAVIALPHIAARAAHAGPDATEAGPT